MSNPTLQELRTLIDSIDQDLACLLQRRFEIALQIRQLKTATTDTAREQDVLNHWHGLAQAHRLSRPFVDQLLPIILNESKRVQDTRSISAQ
jgi:chorismate mutase